MKMAVSIALFSVSCVVFLLSVLFCIYSFVDIHSILQALSADPSASGIDYFGIGWGYGICLFAAASVGLILSLISKQKLQGRILQRICLVCTAGSALLLAVSLVLFFM